MYKELQRQHCHDKYTLVSNHLDVELSVALKEVERFFYSSFWVNRFKRRIQEEDEYYFPIQLDIIQGLTSELSDESVFKVFDESSVQNGISNKGTMIALNVNLDPNELTDSHIKNVIMHEFGHRQYNQKGFNLIVELNKRIIGSAGLFIKDNQVLSKEDYKYFTDHNEIRQRIIPVVKEMYDNGWSIAETYNKSKNLEIDDIKDIYTREYILKLLDNIL